MTGYKVCPSCGRQNPADAQWCASCGNNIANVAQPQNWQQPQQNYQAPPQQYQQPGQYGQQNYQAPPPQYQQPPPYGQQPYYQGQPMPPPVPVKQKSEGLAAVLSFLIPGLGQIYNGEIGKGIGILVLAIILGILFFLLITMVVLLILWIWNIYDAYTTAKEINQRSMMQPGYYQYPR